MFALIVNRTTGDTRAVSAADVQTLSSDWFVVCHEPADTPAPAATDDNGQPLVTAHASIEHRHNAINVPCPTLPAAPLRVLPADDWRPEDLRAINQYAADVLRTDRLVWRLETRRRRGRAIDPVYTEITIETGWKDGSCVPRHALIVRVNGRSSAAALTWLLRQSDRTTAAAILTAIPTTTVQPHGKTGREAHAILNPYDDEPSAADFDGLIGRVRELLLHRQGFADALGRWIYQL